VVFVAERRTSSEPGHDPDDQSDHDDDPGDPGVVAAADERLARSRGYLPWPLVHTVTLGDSP
jgi:hypothetical protein